MVVAYLCLGYVTYCLGSFLGWLGMTLLWETVY